MKKLWKRGCCLLMALLLFCVFLAPAGAAKNVVLTAVNDSFLPLSGSTMPTRQNGEYYVPYSVFSGRLGVRAALRDGTLSLASGNTTLTFNTAAGTVYDQNMNSYSSPAYNINGTIYVPVRLVCGRFGYSYSTLHSGDTLILRICSSAATLSDSDFLSTSNATIRSMLNAYNGVPSTGVPSNNAETTTKKPSSIRFVISGAAADSTSAILNSLELASQEAVFALPTTLEGYDGALLREIAAQKHGFALFVDASAPASVDALTEANLSLFNATGLTTRLLFIEPNANVLTTEQRDSYVVAGYRLWDATHTAAASARATKTVNDLTKAFSEITSAVILDLPHTQAASQIISGINTYMRTFSVSSHEITLLTTPINHANDRR
ncbi:MAG: hypothetical protein IJ042_04035 [Butyricicoccus sp.]|nr:hypothetical protein [Butyricicoccus sp.]